MKLKARDIFNELQQDQSPHERKAFQRGSTSKLPSSEIEQCLTFWYSSFRFSGTLPKQYAEFLLELSTGTVGTRDILLLGRSAIEKVEFINRVLGMLEVAGIPEVGILNVINAKNSGEIQAEMRNMLWLKIHPYTRVVNCKAPIK